MKKVNDLLKKAKASWKQHVDSFANNEEGMELLQVVIIIIIAIIVAGVVWVVVGRINGKLQDGAMEQIDAFDINNIPQDGGGLTNP